MGEIIHVSLWGGPFSMDESNLFLFLLIFFAASTGIPQVIFAWSPVRCIHTCNQVDVSVKSKINTDVEILNYGGKDMTESV